MPSLKYLSLFLGTIFSCSTTLAAPLASSSLLTDQPAEKVYACVLQGPANDLFDKNIRLEMTADNRFLTFYGNEGENCNGQRDDQYRQLPTNPPEPPQPKYYRFLTDCEREDGFIQILTSQALYDGAESGPLKMRIRGAFFHQRYYSCSKAARL